MSTSTPIASSNTDSLRTQALDDTTKGIPLGEVVTLDELAGRGWNVARGDLAYPVTTLRRTALDHNLRTMAQYCSRNGAWLAPHGKTTMSPQLFAEQLAHGSWAITAATPSQAAVMRRHGVPRVLLANEVSDAAAVRWIANEMRNDSAFEVYFLVDNADLVRWTDDVLSKLLSGDGDELQIPVFIELGTEGGRCGARNEAEVLSVAKAVRQARHLRLVGVESFEGAFGVGASTEVIAKVDALLQSTRAITETLLETDFFETETVLVSAGGSSFFDRVVEILGTWPTSHRTVQLILRSGGYVTHDVGKCARSSPLDGRRDSATEPLELVNAIETWARVVSRPEPGIAMLAVGKRDAPYDVDLPTPLRAYRPDGTEFPLEGRAVVVNLMDQHAYVKLDPSVPLASGDLVALGVSHPCTSFDKNRFLPVIDDNLDVIDGVLTFF